MVHTTTQPQVSQQGAYKRLTQKRVASTQKEAITTYTYTMVPHHTTPHNTTPQERGNDWQSKLQNLPAPQQTSPTSHMFHMSACGVTY